jgi:hypothetical protein
MLYACSKCRLAGSETSTRPSVTGTHFQAGFTNPFDAAILSGTRVNDTSGSP